MQLVQPMPSPRDAHVFLSSLLQKTVRIDPDTMRDLLYRVNRPMKSKVLETVNLNRLATWLIGTWQTVVVEIQVGLFPTAPVMPRTQGTPILVCRLELDINTEETPGFQIPQHLLRRTMDELIEQASEIARFGDDDVKH